MVSMNKGSVFIEVSLFIMCRATLVMKGIFGWIHEVQGTLGSCLGETKISKNSSGVVSLLHLDSLDAGRWVMIYSGCFLNGRN